METSDNNDWPTWSRHVLKELQRLNQGQDSIREQISTINSGMSEIGVLKNNLHEIKLWKDSITEVVSPTQLKVHLDKISELEKYKVRSVALFTFIQVTFGAILGIASYLN